MTARGMSGVIPVRQISEGYAAKIGKHWRIMNILNNEFLS
jgi:hypothetical protein